VRDILTSLDSAAPPDIFVVDSIQTMYLDTLDSAPGTVTQVRGAAQELIRYAKRSGSVLLVVGHVTKDGQIAGPRVLEHMVDAVLYFEGERGHQFRIVRAVKNRFGPTDEIGVFEMTGAGLTQVPNPSTLFLNPGRGPVSGAAIFAGIEGTRPVLVEIQALVAPGPPGSPRRTVVGWDSGRLAMVLAVLETRAGLSLGSSDVFLNVAGGLRIAEPAADLAVAAAIVSSYADRPVREGTVVFGEIGLSGEVRPVAQAAARLKESAKLGFTHAIVPRSVPKSSGSGKNKAETEASISDISREEINRVGDVLDLLSPARAASERKD
jgi:DNA repair protein RadA/Sms